MEFCDLNAQQNLIRDKIDNAIARVLEHGQYILGPEVDELEDRLTQFTGSKYCTSCANGTDALQIALMALNIQPGDEVIVPAFTFIATAEAVALLGAKPVFIDICPKTYNLDPELLNNVINKHTKAIIAVSLFGQCADMERISSIANEYNIPVIEDAAQSFGATHRTKKSCNIATISCTSFFPAKPLGCYGDGGAIFTNDEDLADRIKKSARHGQSQRYMHDTLGMNSRLDTIQAAILIEKLKIYPAEIKMRQTVANKYTEALKHLPISTPHILDSNNSVYAQYTINSSIRDKLAAELKKSNIPTTVHYPIPLPEQLVFNSVNQNFSYAKTASETVLSLPMHPYLTKHDIDRVSVAIEETICQ